MGVFCLTLACMCLPGLLIVCMCVTGRHGCVYVHILPHVCVCVRCSAPWKISDSQAADNSRSSALISGFPYPPVGVTTDSFTTGDSSSPYFSLPTTTSTTTTGKHTACMPASTLAETRKKRREKTTPFGANLMRSRVIYRAAQVWLRPQQCPHKWCSCYFVPICPYLSWGGGGVH